MKNVWIFGWLQCLHAKDETIRMVFKMNSRSKIDRCPSLNLFVHEHVCEELKDLNIDLSRPHICEYLIICIEIF